MKIFVSYSRRDADFAQQIDEYFEGSDHDVFTDVNDIRIGSVWSNVIETNISNCDIFVVIVTHAALRSPEVEIEVLQAQRENKVIIPCFHRDVRENESKWDLGRLQGIEFDDRYELARKLYSQISKFPSGDDPKPDDISGSKGGTPSEYISTSTTKKGPSLIHWRYPRKKLRLLIAVIVFAVAGSIVILNLIPLPPPPPPGNLLNIETDKHSYGFGDYVKISGSVEKPEQGKSVRVDVYDPNGDVFEPFDSGVPGYVPQSDRQARPNDKGQFSYRFPTEIPIAPFQVNGTYTIEATYGGVTRNTTFTIR